MPGSATVGAGEHTEETQAAMDSSPIVPEFNSWLEALVKGNGSDLHVKVGSPPMLRLPYGLDRLDRDPLSPLETQAIADGIIPKDRKPIFKERGEVDFAYSVANVGRFRANVFRQRGSISWSFGSSASAAQPFEEIGLPDSIEALADEPRGLILVTGPTGSGKTTTLAAMIGYLNATKAVHIVTIEDPIEVLHKDKLASINQREIGQDTTDFLSALRAALRQDPDVILIGEMRDTETVRAALQGRRNRTPRAVDAAYAGRHRDGQPRDRLLPAASAEAGAAHARRHVARDRLPAAGADDRRRPRPALEILVNTGRVAERIIDAQRTSEIKDVMAEGGYYGMSRSTSGC